MPGSGQASRKRARDGAPSTNPRALTMPPSPTSSPSGESSDRGVRSSAAGVHDSARCLIPVSRMNRSAADLSLTTIHTTGTGGLVQRAIRFTRRTTRCALTLFGRTMKASVPGASFTCRWRSSPYRRSRQRMEGRLVPIAYAPAPSRARESSTRWRTPPRRLTSSAVAAPLTMTATVSAPMTAPLRRSRDLTQPSLPLAVHDLELVDLPSLVVRDLSPSPPANDVPDGHAIVVGVRDEQCLVVDGNRVLHP